MTRTAPHDWLRAFNAFGPEGLNRMRGPKIAAAPVAELERVIGRQQLELEFFFGKPCAPWKECQRKRRPTSAKSSKR